MVSLSTFFFSKMSLDNDGSHSHEGSSEPLDVSPSVSDKLPNTNNIIKGQEFSYAVGRKIAPGRYGAVYEVWNVVLKSIVGAEKNRWEIICGEIGSL